MIPAGVRISDVHSTGITEDERQLSVWVNLSDGGIAAYYVDLDELAAAAHVIEEGTRTPEGAALQ